jgi:large subunit ribosomal protein L25
MNDNVLQVKERSSGKRDVKLIRKQKMVPGIFYTAKEPSMPIAIAEIDLRKTLARKSALITLQMPDGNERECVVREIQRDPVWGNIIHIDLMGITRGQKITVTVPLHVVGLPVGVKEGGILEHSLRELEIECLPKDIPSHLEWDVSMLKVGESIRVEKLSYENIRILTDPKIAIATVVPPKVEKVAAPVEVAEVEGEEKPEEEGEKPEEEKDKSKQD